MSWHPIIETAPIQFSEWVPWRGGRDRLKSPEQSLGYTFGLMFQSRPTRLSARIQISPSS
jgi:hypothetical protein